MERRENLVLSSVLVLAVTFCCVQYALTEPPGRLHNQKCVTFPGGVNCGDVDIAQCSHGQTSCSYCNADTAIPFNKFCIPFSEIMYETVGNVAANRFWLPYFADGLWMRQRQH